MAAIQQEDTRSWREKYPLVETARIKSIEVFHYVVDGHILVDLGHWLVLVSGRVSEPVLLLATMWITAVYVAPQLTALLGTTADMLSSFSVLAISLLPEIVVFSAVVKLIKLYQSVSPGTGYKENIKVYLWPVLYTLPTGTFVVLTLYTLGMFAVTHGHIQAADSTSLIIRCMAAWLYSFMGVLHPYFQVSKKDEQSHSLAATVATLREQIDHMTQQHAHDIQQTITRMEEETTRITTLLKRQQQEAVDTAIQEVTQRLTTGLVDTSNNLVENVFDNPKRLLEKVVEDEKVVENVFDIPEKVVDTSEKVVEKVVVTDGLHQGVRLSTSLVENLKKVVEKDEKVVETLSSDEVRRVLEAYTSGIVKSKLCSHLHIGTGKYKAIGKVVDDYEKSNKVVEKV